MVCVTLVVAYLTITRFLFRIWMNMNEIVLTSIIVFLISLVFSIFGKGGGSFYLLVLLALLPITFYDAAGVSLFLIFVQGVSMAFVYSHKHKLIDWNLVLILAVVTAISSFLGGFVSFGISEIYLKITFAIFLLISAFLLFLNKNIKVKLGSFGVWHRKFLNTAYNVHLIYLLTGVGLAGFLAGMIGVSGGGLIIPLAVILGGMPIKIAIGTNTILILISSLTGFIGHITRGTIDFNLCAIVGLFVLAGSQIGARLHARVNEKFLRLGLAILLISAALWMVASITY